LQEISRIWQSEYDVNVFFTKEFPLFLQMLSAEELAMRERKTNMKTNNESEVDEAFENMMELLLLTTET
jgi:hypothetical protein